MRYQDFEEREWGSDGGKCGGRMQTRSCGTGMGMATVWQADAAMGRSSPFPRRTAVLDVSGAINSPWVARSLVVV